MSCAADRVMRVSIRSDSPVMCACPGCLPCEVSAIPPQRLLSALWSALLRDSESECQCAVQALPNKMALVVNHENITQNWYVGNDRSMLVCNCLFRLGGAGALLSNR